MLAEVAPPPTGECEHPLLFSSPKCSFFYSSKKRIANIQHVALQMAFASLNVVTYPGLMFGAVSLLNCLLHPPFVLEETCPVSVCVCECLNAY